MLHIYFGPMEGAIYNTAVFFRNSYLDEWLEDEFAQQMIKSVDGAEVLGPNAIKSRVLGVIPPTGLSGGVKTLLLVYNMPDKVFNASTCGDNCARWLLRIAQKQDVTINLRHLMDFGSGRFTIEIANCGKIVHSMAEMIEPAGHLLAGDAA